MECKICFEHFNTSLRKPITLMFCGHSICQQCLNELKKQHEKLLCPACRKEVQNENIKYKRSIYFNFRLYLILMSSWSLLEQIEEKAQVQTKPNISKLARLPESSEFTEF